MHDLRPSLEEMIRGLAKKEVDVVDSAKINESLSCINQCSVTYEFEY